MISLAAGNEGSLGGTRGGEGTAEVCALSSEGRSTGGRLEAD